MCISHNEPSDQKASPAPRDYNKSATSIRNIGQIQRCLKVYYNITINSGCYLNRAIKLQIIRSFFKYW